MDRERTTKAGGRAKGRGLGTLWAVVKSRGGEAVNQGGAQLLEGLLLRLARQSIPLGEPRKAKETRAVFCEPQAI